MYDKRNLEIDFKITYLDLKNLGKYYFLPIIIMFIVVPTLLILKYLVVKDMKSLITDMIAYTELFSAISSIWWIMMISRQYIEVDGNELLYVYKKIRIGQVLILFFWYTVNISILFLGYSFFFENILSEYIKILIQSLFFISISYMLVYTFKLVSIPMMITLGYIISFSLFFKSKINYINIFTIQEIANSQIVSNKYLILIIITIFVLFIGVYKNYKYLN